MYWIQTGVYQKAREVIVKKESKQRKLAAAFETLIHTSAKPTLTKNTGKTFLFYSVLYKIKLVLSEFSNKLLSKKFLSLVYFG